MYCLAPVAGAFSGLIAYGTAKDLEGVHGRPSWEWLFIIEGVATLGFSFFVFVLLPGLPERVAEKGSLLFRHPTERQLIQQRLAESKSFPASRPNAHTLPGTGVSGAMN